LMNVFQANGDVASSAKIKAAAVVSNLIDQQAQMLSFIDNFHLLAIAMGLLIPFVFIVMKRATMKDRGGGAAH
jgi:hypothetical protein